MQESIKKKLALLRKKKTPKPRSVLFWRNNYYHFYYLSRALRKRGWDVLLVSVDDPNGPFINYHHGQDVILYDPDPQKYRSLLDEFLKKTIKRYSLLHFSGDGYLCFSPYESHLDVCNDIVSWRKAGNKIAYTIGGCNSATSQTSVTNWSALDGSIVCNTCPWQNSPEICCDSRNLAWGRKLEKYCDYIFAETLPALDYISMPERVYREPVSMCLDPDFWSPDLEIPEEYRIKRKPKELLIYHAMGNYTSRTVNDRNIKGTPAIKDAVERLQAEGFSVRLIFVTDMKNTEVRFIQAQADIIVDQLNYGRYGATAREGMMLGKPVICYINKNELATEFELESLKTLPLISASEKNIYEVLKDLVLTKEKLKKIGHISRQYALEWFSADKCAERYEKIYDELMQRVTPLCCYPTNQIV